MAEKTQMNVQVLQETKDHVKEIAGMTFRSYGDVIDWLVAEAWKKLQKKEQPK